MSRSFSALVLAAVFAMAPLLRAADQPAASPYFPLKVGTTWVQKIGSKDSNTVKVIRHEKVGDVVCGVLETSTPTGQTYSETVGVTKEGIYRFKGNNTELKPPLLLLPLNPKKGDKFTIDSRSGGGSIKGTFTIGQEDVTVPAGKYKAITTRCAELAVGTEKWSITNWYAPGVGLVKQELKVGSSTVVMELSKYTAGK